MKPKFLWFFPLFLGNQIVNFVQSDSPFFSFERPRRLKELKALYTLLWLYQIFWRRWWMWNSRDWVREQWMREEGKWVRVERVSEWERLRFSVRVRGWVRAWECLLCVRERVSESGECLICVRGVNFEKNPTWNRVLKTRFPCVLHVELGHIKLGKPSLKDSIYRPKIESLRLEMLVNYIVWEPGLLTI